MRKLLDSGAVEIAPLAYMRGRTLQNSIVLLDEGQNTTQEQMKMFLTRSGEGSKVIVTGDSTQIDLPKRTPSGLIQALGLLQNIPGIACIQMDASDCVRSGLVRKIVEAYENAEK
jgi:phosphate starvation-inducible PhoH-like protein